VKYQCCECSSLFAGSQIKDDYKNGIKVGFLCPQCGANIKDDLNGSTLFGKNAKGTVWYYLFLIVIFFFDDYVGQYISEPLGLNNWLVQICLLIIASFVYLSVNRKLINWASIFTTSKVREQ